MFCRAEVLSACAKGTNKRAQSKIKSYFSFGLFPLFCTFAQMKRTLVYKWLFTLGRYILLMGRTFSRPERFRMFWKKYVTEMQALGVDSIGIVLLISFFIGDIELKISIR